MPYITRASRSSSATSTVSLRGFCNRVLNRGLAGRGLRFDVDDFRWVRAGISPWHLANCKSARYKPEPLSYKSLGRELFRDFDRAAPLEIHHLPCRIRRVAREKHAADDVVDEREVARLFAVAVDHRTAPAQKRRG